MALRQRLSSAFAFSEIHLGLYSKATERNAGQNLKGPRRDCLLDVEVAGVNGGLRGRRAPSNG
jgi:hypothetical protein